LSRFCAAIESTRAAEPGELFGFDGLDFDFFAVAIVRILIPATWRVRPLGGLTLTLSLPRFFPRSARTMSRARPRKLNGTGKSKLTKR
jgi:hypothetical protein